MKKVIVNILLVTGFLFSVVQADYTGVNVAVAIGGPDFSDKDLPPQHTPGGNDDQVTG
ncbi:hypothetical protein [Guptibacillus algicola]|uniref:hypothetical protein n=1 Tax=Guptibacillus algicola TaxID=225844 RepID=UPI001CD40638|nr:hypothetical protein [Alkalihalobacillus algicola]MCA0986996.1 hypothetical protein [Alkalihalobacillus algicola]